MRLEKVSGTASLATDNSFQQYLFGVQGDTRTAASSQDGTKAEVPSKGAKTVDTAKPDRRRTDKPKDAAEAGAAGIPSAVVPEIADLVPSGTWNVSLPIEVAPSKAASAKAIGGLSGFDITTPQDDSASLPDKNAGLKDVSVAGSGIANVTLPGDAAADVSEKATAQPDATSAVVASPVNTAETPAGPVSLPARREMAQASQVLRTPPIPQPERSQPRQTGDTQGSQIDHGETASSAVSRTDTSPVAAAAGQHLTASLPGLQSAPVPDKSEAQNAVAPGGTGTETQPDERATAASGLVQSTGASPLSVQVAALPPAAPTPAEALSGTASQQKTVSPGTVDAKANSRNLSRPSFADTLTGQGGQYAPVSPQGEMAVQKAGASRQESQPDSLQAGETQAPVAATGNHLQQGLQRSEMQVHIDAAEFGRVSVRATYGHEGFTAHIGLEDTAMGLALQGALSTHASTMEHRLQDGLGGRASVSVSTGTDTNSRGGTGEQGGSSSRRQGSTLYARSDVSVSSVTESTGNLSTAAVHSIQAGRQVDVRI